MSEQLVTTPEFNAEQVEIIIWDLGNVVFKFIGGIQKLAADLNVPIERCLEVWAALDQDICSGSIRPENLVWKMINDKSCQYPVNDFASFWVEHFQPIVETYQFMIRIAEVLPVGILSNIYSRQIYELALQLKKIPQLNYSVVILSSEERCVKPDQQIYKITEAKVREKKGFAPWQILFIDDGEKNVLQAKAMGWQAVIFDETTIAKLEAAFLRII